MQRAALPAFLLGSVAFYWLCLFIGPSNVQEADYFWLFVLVVAFDYLLATHNRGKQILARALRYLAYELWLTPLFIAIGMLGNGLPGAVMGIVVITSISVVLALFGLVCYIISNNIFKADRIAKRKRRLRREKEQLAINEGKTDAIKTTIRPSFIFPLYT